MKRRLLECGLCLLIILTLAWAYWAMSPAPAPEADARLTLSTSRNDYLLGEPVVLELAFRNDTNDTIKVYQVYDQPQRYVSSLVYIAKSGGEFQLFRPPYAKGSKFVWVFPHPPPITLSPGESLKYQYRVVADQTAEEFALAFPKPGDYRVYLEYSPAVVGAPQYPPLASNVVQVRIKQPTGDDAKIWKELNNESFLGSLQVESLDSDEIDILTKTAELLRDYPNSGYAPALRHFLSKVAPTLRHHLSFHEANLLEEVLGLKGFAPVEHDPSDKRLDAIRKDSYEHPITVGEVLHSLSKASGAPLDAPAEYKKGTMSMADSLTTVRQCMSAMRSMGDWEKRGNGYFLVPQKPPEAKKADGDKP